MPVLKITLSKTTPVVDEDITLRVTSTKDVTPTTAQWNFADGAQANTVMTTHRWATARTYQVSVQAVMPDGQPATTSVSLVVSVKPKARLTVTAPTHGSVTGPGITCPATCAASIDKGQTVTLTARPAANYTFAGWGGACSGTATCRVLMDTDKTVTATFRSAVEPFVGTWSNVDPNTRSIPQIQVTALSATTATLHVWGACTPSWCDWGTTTATLSGGKLRAFYDQDFATRTITMSLVNGQVVMEIFNDYIPPDDREDRTTVDTLRKK